MPRKPNPFHLRREQRKLRKSDRSLDFALLEDRCMLALTATVIDIGGIEVLSVAQIGGGDVGIDNNGVSDSETNIQFADFQFDRLDIDVGFENNATVDFAQKFTKDIHLKLNGTSTLLFQGDNTIEANLRITGDQGIQVVGNNADTRLSVSGDLEVNLGQDLNPYDPDLGDEVSLSSLSAGNVKASGVSVLSLDHESTIHGDFEVQALDEFTVVQLINTMIQGDFDYQGAGRIDRVLALSTTANGKTTVELGDNDRESHPSFVDLHQGFILSNTNQFSDLEVNSTGTGFRDEFGAGSSTTIGNLKLNYGDGPNHVVISGTVSGDSISYTGGDGIDWVSFNAIAEKANASFALGAGNDEFSLIGIAANLIVDFGGVGTFSNLLGSLPFDTKLQNFNGFEIDYSVADQKLVFTQSTLPNTTMPLSIDADSDLFAFSYDGMTYEIMPAQNIEVALPGTGDVTAGETDIDLKVEGNFRGTFHGDRTINMKGKRFDRDSIAGVKGLTEIFGDGGAQTITTLNGNFGSDEVNKPTVAGDVRFNLGDGNNSLNFYGSADGQLRYRGGAGIDNVQTTLMPRNTETPTIFAAMGADEDRFELQAGSQIADLRVDFGLGVDAFVNGVELFDFGTRLLNLDGFHRVLEHFESAPSRWTLFQATLAGATAHKKVTFGQDVNFDGVATNYHLMTETETDNVLTQFPLAEDLRIFLESNSGTQLDIDFDAEFLGDLLLQLQNGDRVLNFVGETNSVAGEVTILGGDGDQTVNLAPTTAFKASGNVQMNLNGGNDSVMTENGGELGMNFRLLGVNDFTNNGKLTVTSNIGFRSGGETTKVRFDNNGILSTHGFFYFGGSTVDEVLINDGVTINGNAYINMAEGTTTEGDMQRVSMSLGSTVKGMLTVAAGPATNGNLFNSDANTKVDGNIFVKFLGGQNQAFFWGDLKGDSILYGGGDGSDDVTLGAAAADSAFAAFLGKGEDSFTLENPVAVTSAMVNFGEDNDTFTNNTDGGQFPLELENLEPVN